MSTQSILLSIVAIGCGATLIMDAWLAVLRRLGVQTLNFAMIGRWAGHLAQGRFAHASIAKAAPVRGELALGWAVHYLIGIGFAGLLVALAGSRWIEAPTLVPAILFGIASVAAPLLVMQPAMGLGFFASRAPRPLPNCLRSLVNHTVFGTGLFLAASALSRITH